MSTFTTCETDDGTIKWVGGGGDDIVNWFYSDWAVHAANYIFNAGGSNGNWGIGDTINFHFTEQEWLKDEVQADMALFVAFIDSLAGKHASGQTFDFSAFDVALKNFEIFKFFIVGDNGEVIKELIDPRAPYVVDDEIDGIVEAGGSDNTEPGNGVGVINVLANDADVDDPDGLAVVSARHVDVEASDTVAVGPGATEIQGKYGTLYIQSDGTTTYVLGNDDPDTQALAQGASASDVFIYEISDGDPATANASATVTVTITGTNDAPVVTSDAAAAAGTVVEAGNEDDGPAVTGTSSVSGQLTSEDADDGAAATWSGDTTDPYGEFTIDADTGEWTFTLDQDAADHLAEGASIERTFTATVTDDKGAWAEQTVTVTITGTNDAPVVTSDAAAAAGTVVEAGNEDDGPAVTGTPSVSGQLTSDDADDGAAATWSGDTTDPYGEFTIDADTGEWTFTLDQDAADHLAEGASIERTFTATVTDDKGAWAEQTVTVTITGTNDAPVVTAGGTLAYAEGDAPAVINDGIDLSDVDSAELVGAAVSITGGYDPAEDMLGFSDQNGITGSYNAGVLTLSGTATLADYEAALRSVTYFNSSNDPSAATRTISFQVDDGNAENNLSNVATSTVTVEPIEDEPPVDVQIGAPAHSGSRPNPVITTVVITFGKAVDPDTLHASDFQFDGQVLESSHIVGSEFSDGNKQWTVTLDYNTGNSKDTGTIMLLGSGYSFSDGTGGVTATRSDFEIHPAGISGESTNLGLTIPASEDGALVTVTVADLPEGWVLNGGWTQAADGSWTIQTTDVRQLSVTTPVAFAGALVLDMAMSWSSADGSTHSAHIANNVEAFAPGNPIIAWSGDDHLTGAAGVAGTFVVAQPVGNVAIYSFEAADKINLIGFDGIDSFENLVIANDPDGNAVVTLADGSSITIVGVGAADLTGANFVFGEVPELTNDATIEVGDGAMLPLSGLVHNSGTIEMNSAGEFTLLQLIRDGIDIDGGGQIVMSDSDGNVIMGTTPDIVLTNVDNTISGAGHIGYGQMTLVNHGLIVATGTHSLEIDTGLNAVVNTGTLQSTGSGGLNVQSDVVNDGLIWAYGGDITVLGAVSGLGSAMISGTATVTFGSAVTIDVDFDEDAAGTLVLGDSFSFDGLISGMDGDDRLVLADLVFSSDLVLTYLADGDGTGGTLTLSGGAQNASIGLLGQYDASWFQFEEDGNGGTVVTYADV